MGSNDVEPLEDRAYITIDVTDDGYLRIEQSVGDQPMYTPEEARELAEDLVAAADRAEAQSGEE
jgi:hypothetical protein